MINDIRNRLAKEKQREVIKEEDEEDSSDEDSDSEPSDDNLDANELMKIMPQKVSKKKIGGGRRRRNNPTTHTKLKRLK